MIKLLIVSTNAAALAIYRETFEALGACCDCAESLGDMHHQLKNMPYHGVVVDVLTASKAAHKDKVLMQEISDTYPTLRVRCNAVSRQVRGMVIGQFLDKTVPLRDYLNRLCRSVDARIFRESKRLAIHFNVLLSKTLEFSSNQVEKTITFDVSRSGCFIMSSQEWNDIEEAWVRILELSDPNPIQVQIRRYLPWGKQPRISGVGVEFKNLQPEQLKEIHRHWDDH